MISFTSISTAHACNSKFILLSFFLISFRPINQPNGYYSMKNEFQAIKIRGKIVDENSNGLPFVNIGIADMKLGTVSDESGNFSLKVTPDQVLHRLKISCIGCETKEFIISDLIKEGQSGPVMIHVQKTYTPLPGIVVNPHKFKERILGNESTSKFVSGGFSTSDLGAEAGARINIKKAPTYLEKVSFHLSYNKLDSIRVRLNIYNLKNGQPAENLLPENVIIHLKNKQTGQVEIDLSKYNLAVNNDVLVALELIEGQGDLKSGVFLSASFLGSTYFRETSQSKWKVYKGLSLGINVSVLY